MDSGGSCGGGRDPRCRKRSRSTTVFWQREAAESGSGRQLPACRRPRPRPGPWPAFPTRSGWKTSPGLSMSSTRRGSWKAMFGFLPRSPTPPSWTSLIPSSGAIRSGPSPGIPPPPFPWLATGFTGRTLAPRRFPPGEDGGRSRAAAAGGGSEACPHRTRIRETRRTPAERGSTGVNRTWRGRPAFDSKMT